MAMTTADAPGGPAVLRVLGIGGSLRAGSYNRALVRAAREEASSVMEIEIYDIAPIPFYNADVEARGDPEPVAAFKAAIRAADALLIATPEYNHGVPGVLKNALDWASRPHGRSPLDCKPVAIMGATAGRGSTFQAQAQLRAALVYTGSCTLAQPELSLSQAGAAFDDGGRLTDPDTATALRELLEAFAEWVRVIYSGEGERYQTQHARLTSDLERIARASLGRGASRAVAVAAVAKAHGRRCCSPAQGASEVRHEHRRSRPHRAGPGDRAASIRWLP
ncbi:MAG: NADPH-dependent FMN reductase [Ktedonobacterales bacterium]